MQDKTIIPQLSNAVRSGDLAAVRTIVSRHLDELKKEGWLEDFLGGAARRDQVEMVQLLVELGADIHGQSCWAAPDGVILPAAGAGAINVVRWLLQHGAQINFEVEGEHGESQCMPLVRATHQGHLDVVKLLVEEAGANVNALCQGFTPLSYAIMYGKKEVEAYLRSKGALVPWQITGEPPPGAPAGEELDLEEEILDHLGQHLGDPEPLALTEIVPGDPPISIHAVYMADMVALVTAGMSSRPMTVPAGGEEYRYAELVIYLPPDWPLDEQTLRDERYFWPIAWLRRIAHYPQENHTWLGGPSTIIANGEPPKPLAANTKLSCLLLATEAGDFGTLHLADREIVFYTIHPLYTEERDLEKAQGVPALIRLFQQHNIGMTVDVQRPNVALPPGGKRRKDSHR